MNELMIPNKANVPAYVMNPELARKANEEASAGISTGFPARIKLSQKSFIMVNSAGEEKPYPASKLFIAPDENQYLPVVVIASKPALSKQWYATAFNPSEDGKQPDCFSLDSLRPAPSSASPQSETCAACPHNQFGSGKDQAGNPTKGKACSDTKILAVFVAGFGVHMLRIPPDSLKNFGSYVKQLTAAGIPVSYVKTLVGFDTSVTTPRLVFNFGGYLPENTIPKIEELKGSVEALEIVGGTPSAALPAPAASSLVDPRVAEIEAIAKAEAAAKAKADEAAKKAKAEAKAEAKAKADAATKAAAQNTVLDMDLGLDGTASLSPEPLASPAMSAGDVSDDDLMKELGL